MPIDLPLMTNNITREDLDRVIEFLRGEPILTNSKRCREFEEAWSEWLGVERSVFVNSGSSANVLTMAVLRELVGGGEILVPPLTWVSDIVAVLQAGFTPIFVDIERKNLAMSEEGIVAALGPKTKAVFLTHALGFNGLTEGLLSELDKRGVLLVEDVCESHGASFRGKKLGAHGFMSNFSFYYAHHLTTIEGGMVCTNDERAYQLARAYRSHGMTREMTSEVMKDEYRTRFPDLRPEFIFAYPGFNFRSTEINAVLGISQLERLDANNRARRSNLELFLSRLDPNRYFVEFDVEGSCNYAFVLLLREPDDRLRDRVIDTLIRENVEFRRGASGGGNQLRQPYLRRLFPEIDPASFPVVDFVHFYGFYLGNYPALEAEKIERLAEALNGVK